MPKRRLQSSKSQSHQLRRSGYRKRSVKELNIVRFMGVSLSGGKNEKTCIVTIDYYPHFKKIFIKEIKDRIDHSDKISQDKELVRILNKKDKDLNLIAIDSPLFLPHCLTHPCPGIEKCKTPSTKWKWKHYRRIKKKKKNIKLFTPYTERAIERYINYELEEHFEMPEALGASKAPLTARSVHLKSRIKNKLIEVYPKLSLWRIGRDFSQKKDHLKHYKHSAHGLDYRKKILHSLISENRLFIYDQDLHVLIDNGNAFDAMLCALTAYLKHQGQCEKPPKGFPTQEGWVEFPKIEFAW